MDSDKLETSLINSVGGDLKDLSADLGEVALDSFIQNDVVKDIPIIGSLLKLYRTSLGIKEYLFAKKVYKFLFELQDIPLETRQDFVNKIEAEDNTHKVGESLIILLDKLDDMSKPGMVGKAFKALLLDEINYYTYKRIAHIINSAFIEDLIDLKEIYTPVHKYHVDTPALDSLVGLGLMGAKKTGTGYTKNKFGEIVYDILFKEEE